MKREKMGPLQEVYKGIIFKISQREVLFPDGTKKIFEYCARPDSKSIDMGIKRMFGFCQLVG
jgi:hypothetical protein